MRGLRLALSVLALIGGLMPISPISGPTSAAIAQSLNGDDRGAALAAPTLRLAQAHNPADDPEDPETISEPSGISGETTDDEDPENAAETSQPVVDPSVDDPEDPELHSTPSPTTGGPELERETASGEPVPLDLLIGRWADPDGRLTGVLVRESGAPADAVGIEFHTARRVWTGEYLGIPEDPVVARLRYRPRAEEMDTTIPLRAREQVAGELEWELELSAVGKPYEPKLKLLWHRQQIRWTDSGDQVGEAEIIKEGEPLEFMLRYTPVLAVEQEGSIRTAIYPLPEPSPDNADDRKDWPEPLTSVMQHQPFAIAVHIPEHRAREIGDSITVKLKGLATGATAEITLAAGVPNVGTVTYSIDEGVYLGNCQNRARYQPAFLSVDWFWMLVADPTQRCVELVESGEELVEVSFGESFYRFQYYATWADAQLARQLTRITDYRNLYETMRASDDQPPAAREAAVRGVRLINNYESLMRLESLTPLHKIAIGEIYLGGERGYASYLRPRRIDAPAVSPAKGLLFLTDEEVKVLRLLYGPTLDHGSSTMWLDAARLYGGEQLGTRAANATVLAPNVVWQMCVGAAERRPSPLALRDLQLERLREMKCIEQQAVYTAVLHVSRQALNDISKAFFVKSTFFYYEGTVNFSPAGDFYTVFTGYNIYGKKATDFEYWAAAVSAGLEIGVIGARLHRFTKVLRYNDALRQGRVAKGGPNLADFLKRSRVGIKSTPRLKRFVVAKNVSPDLAATANRSRRGLPGPSPKAPDLGPVTTAKPPPGSIQIARDLDEVDDFPQSLSGSQQQAIAKPFQPSRWKPDPGEFVESGDEVRLSLRQPNLANVPGSTDDLVFLKSELANDWGGAASVSGFRGVGASTDLDYKVFAPAIGDFNKTTVAENYTIWRATGRDLDEAEGVLQQRLALSNLISEQPDLQAGAASYGFSQPMPNVVRNRRLSEMGLKISELPLSGDAPVKLADLKALRDAGFVTEVPVSVGGRTRPVVIEDILFDADGTPVTVRVFDPRFGALVDADADLFHAAIVLDQPDALVRISRATDPDVAPVPLDFGFEAVPPRIGGAAAGIKVVAVPTPNTIFSFKTAGGRSMTIRLGERIGDGRYNQVFRSPDFPRQVVRIAKMPSDPSDLTNISAALDGVEFDLFGRKALENPKLNRAIVDAPSQRGVHRTQNGGAIEVVDVFDGTEAKNLLDAQPGRKLTRGQALAYEGATRELNKAGYVWTDGHSGNFSFVKLPGEDRWKIVIFDPGGIIPVKGTPAQRAVRAREMQQALQQPDLSDLGTNLDLDYSVKIVGEDFQELYVDDIDYDALNLAPGTYVPATPRIALQNPLVRELFDLPEAELARALGPR